MGFLLKGLETGKPGWAAIPVEGIKDYIELDQGLERWGTLALAGLLNG